MRDEKQKEPEDKGREEDAIQYTRENCILNFSFKCVVWPPLSQFHFGNFPEAVPPRSAKLMKIFRHYRDGELKLPRNAELEEKYRSMMGLLNTALTSADDHILQRIHVEIAIDYKYKVVSGVVCGRSPDVPKSGPELYEFIDGISSVYDIFLIDVAVEILKNKKLTKKFNVYRKSLRDCLKTKLKSCKKRNVSLPPLRRDYVSVAVAIDEDQVLLALVIQLREYFVKTIRLQECLLEGFQEGCVIFYFAITAVDAVLVAPKILSHLGELKTRFSVTHVVVFGHFAVNVESGTFDLLVSLVIAL